MEQAGYFILHTTSGKVCSGRNRINCTHQTGWIGGRLLFLIVGPIFDILAPSATHAGDHHPPYLACFVSAKVMSHCAPSLTGATKTFVFGSWS